LKTGFTCKAGFNLVAVATREEKHLVGIILGESTAAARDARMMQVMKLGFAGHEEPLLNLDTLPESPDQGGEESVNQKMIAKECINPQGVRRYMTVKDWSVEFGVEVQRQAAINRARGFIKKHRGLLKGGRPLLIPRMARRVIYRVGVTGLAKANATNTCLGIRSDSVFCVVRSPKSANYAMDKAHRVLEAMAKRDKQSTD
jgi:D-alanyl-D-alanine carboxypeptidase